MARAAGHKGSMDFMSQSSTQMRYLGTSSAACAWELRSIEGMGLPQADNGSGGFKLMPIQHHEIPIAVVGHDLMACAQTRAGKTPAFCLPMVFGVLHDCSK